MKKLLFIFSFIVGGISLLFANGVRVGDLYYLLDDENHTAEVTFQSQSAINAHNDNWNITTANIPESVYYNGSAYRVICIGLNAFHNCKYLKYVKMSSNIVEIKERAFQGCNNLIDIDIPNNVTSIGMCAFSGCTSLKSIVIPESVQEIGDMAFTDCKNLVNISLPSKVKSFGKTTFWNCKSLHFVIIPEGVTVMRSTFWGCEQLTYVKIPNSVTKILGSAFSGCKNLKNIVIPESVQELGSFPDCSKLESLIIPRNVKGIENNAFINCFGLQELYYPRGLDLSKANISSTTKCISYDRKNPPKIVIEATKVAPANIANSQNDQPPLLTLVSGTVRFTDGSKNNRLDAGESSTICFMIRNNGKGAANNCEIRVKLSGSTSGIKVQNIKLPSIAVGQTYEVSIPVSADINTQDGKVTFSIEVYEPNGWGVVPFDLTVATKAYEAPFLQVVDYQIVSNSGKIKKMEPFTLTFNLQNTKYGDAEQVKVKVNLPANIFVMDGSAEQSFAQIKSGETKTITLTLAANNNYLSTDIPITIDIKERYGKFAENKQLNIALNQTTSSSINIAAKDEPKQERKEIQLATLTAEVDRNIPQTTIKNSNTFVLIIANENYQSVASVPFALNDGRIFRQYCEQTLGIPSKNIHMIANATGNQIKAQINWLRNVVEVFDNPNVIFYYAGHGIPDESSKTAYLLPVDGSGTDVSTGYKLDDLYAALGNMPASRITVFMDACFSGSKREEGMLAEARGVALKAKSGTPQGNMVVFSAAQGNETAYPNREKQHGLFTYYLLKKLQETEGNVSLQDLGSYIITNVKQQSVLLNSKLQTPCVTPSSVVADSWQNWKLK